MSSGIGSSSIPNDAGRLIAGPPFNHGLPEHHVQHHRVGIDGAPAPLALVSRSGASIPTSVSPGLRRAGSQAAARCRAATATGRPGPRASRATCAPEYAMRGELCPLRRVGRPQNAKHVRLAYDPPAWSTAPWADQSGIAVVGLLDDHQRVADYRATQGSSPGSSRVSPWGGESTVGSDWPSGTRGAKVTSGCLICAAVATCCPAWR